QASRRFSHPPRGSAVPRGDEGAAPTSLSLTALSTGLRLGELIALRWDDIQFGDSEDDSNRYIMVSRNYTRGKFTTPKNKKPRRVDMSRELRRVLMELRDAMTLEAFERGEA